MAEQTEQDDRTEEPTQRKLDQAREKGDVIYTPEVAAAFSLFAATFVLAFLSGPIASSLGTLFSSFLAAPQDFGTDPEALRSLGFTVFIRVTGVLALAALGFVLAGIAARYVQDKPSFTNERMKPKLDKIDPIKGFGRVFGKAAIANFWKSCAKLAIVGAALLWALWPNDDSIGRLSLLDPAALLPFVKEKTVSLLMSLACAAAVIAGVDYAFARQSFLHRMKMSRREIKDEMKQSEGDPQIRMRIRQLRSERARQRMMANVPKAAVVIMNPTHYAVALRYDSETPAPMCVAKGVDDVALRIRDLAEAHDVPIIQDPPLARALFAATDVDEPIPREHYEAVAKIIGLVMRLAARKRASAGARGAQPPNRRQ
ncbi:MAG: flagellar biosynthesis protein FlhB [Hyphomonadaceae bacterium]